MRKGHCTVVFSSNSGRLFDVHIKSAKGVERVYNFRDEPRPYTHPNLPSMYKTVLNLMKMNDCRPSVLYRAPKDKNGIEIICYDIVWFDLAREELGLQTLSYFKGMA